MSYGAKVASNSLAEGSIARYDTPAVSFVYYKE